MNIIDMNDNCIDVFEERERLFLSTFVTDDKSISKIARCLPSKIILLLPCDFGYARIFFYLKSCNEFRVRNRLSENVRWRRKPLDSLSSAVRIIRRT